MTGKTLSELTSAELRAECTARGLSISGSKPDLIIRLEQEIRDQGLEPEDVVFYHDRETTAVPTQVDSEADWSDGQQPNGGLEVPQGQKTPAGSRPGQGMSQPTRASLPPLDAPIPAKIHCALLEKDSVVS